MELEFNWGCNPGVEELAAETTERGPLESIAVLGGSALTFLSTLLAAANFAVMIWAGISLYYFTGGQAPRDFFRMSFSAYLVAALVGSLIVSALGILCVYTVYPEKDYSGRRGAEVCRRDSVLDRANRGLWFET